MADIEAGSAGAPDLGKVLEDGGPKAVVEALKKLPIVMVGRQTCAYSLEANGALASAAANLGGADAVTTFWTNRMPSGPAVHTALKEETKQATVPYVFINGEFIGGCDDTKRLQASGELAPKLYAAAAAHGMSPKARAKQAPKGSTADAKKHAHDASAEELNYLPDDNFVDETFKNATAEAAPPAYPPLFYFPEVVDQNTIRLTSGLVVIVCCLGIAFRTHTWAHYMILALALDNLLRFCFGPGPSPLGQLARCIAVFIRPSFRPGIPKQFAVFCGTFMSVVAMIFMFLTGFDSQEIIASCFLGVYAALAFLECVFDFCMGCVIFGFMVKLGLLPPEVYALGIATRPETVYTYDEVTKWVDLPEPSRVRVGYPGKQPSAIDVQYKTKSNDHDRQSFNPLKHVKIVHFNIVLSLCGLAALFRLADVSDAATGMALGSGPGDALGIIGAIALCVFVPMYAYKAWNYPNKIRKEWFCSMRSNAFVVPPGCLVLLAFVTDGRFDNADTLAKVLFWIGAPIVLAISLWLAARWITDAHSQEHLNPAMLLPPLACFVCALVGPLLSLNYAEASYLWYSFGVAIAVPIYVITFHRALTFNEPDDRNRPLKWTWVAAPAVACIAQAVLVASTAAGDDNPLLGSPLLFAAFSRPLYFISLSLAMVLGLLFFTGHASRLKFDSLGSWTIAFPLEALAMATVVYAAAVPGDLPRGMAYAGLAISSWTVLVLTLHSLQQLLMWGFFTSDAKYGPLSQQMLTHEAFRAAGERLKVAVAALGSDTANPFALQDFALQFRRYRLAHAWHAFQEDSVIFKEFENYVPGLCSRQHQEHEDDEAAMARWGDALEALEACDGADKVALSMLTSEIPAFIDGFENHLKGEEEHLQRGGRKQMNMDLQKAMLRRIFDATPMDVWAEFMPFVVQNLPMHGQRVKFVRCWATWALPERAQLIGRFIAMGVDPYVWERLVRDVPEIAPRGEPRWRRFG